MNQKGFVTIIAIIGIIILAGSVGYFIVNKQASSPTPIPTPSPTPISTSQPTTLLSPTEFKYLLEDKFGKATFCGPPVEPPDYEDKLLKQFPTVVANTEEFSVILKHTNIANDGSLTDQEKLTIVYEHNRMSVISLEPSNSKYKFSIRSRSQGKRELISEGFITQSGSISISKQEPYRYGCPICLAGNTLIDTPSGLVPVKDVQVGMPIWTTDKAGHRVSGFVMKTSKVPVPPIHEMVRLVLDDGRELFVSPGHPTIDGRSVSDLMLGDLYDGASIVSAQRVPYDESATYDVLPSGETGFYWANGVQLGSTLYQSNKE